MNLVRNGSKPKLWFVGDEWNDPILMVFETPKDYNISATASTGHKMMIIQYENLAQMKQNISTTSLVLPTTVSTYNEGSPSFESVDWRGSIHTSNFVLLFEYQQGFTTNKKFKLAKGIYSYTGEATFNTQNSFTWEAFPITTFNDVMDSFGYNLYFGSRHKFNYDTEDFYLQESTRVDAEAETQIILLCDSTLTPLAEL